MFYDDPRVIYFSIHRYEHGEFWPNLRESDYDHIGEGGGKGYNINIPLNKVKLKYYEQSFFFWGGGGIYYITVGRGKGYNINITLNKVKLEYYVPQFFSGI